MKKLLARAKTKVLDVFYGQVPMLAKAMGVTTIWTRKFVGWFMWIGLAAILIEVACRQWSSIIPTFAAITASMAFTEAQKMRRSFKAWGFEEGPGNVNK